MKKEIKFMFAVVFQDEHGEVIHTFKSKKEAEEFYEVLYNETSHFKMVQK